MSLLRCDMSQKILMFRKRRSITGLLTAFTGFWLLFRDKWTKSGNKGALMTALWSLLMRKRSFLNYNDPYNSTIMFSQLQ